jgi:hypothetical protein
MGSILVFACQSASSHSPPVRAIARLAFVLVILAGLLSFPTFCTCRATIAHAHSLFLIPYHHHDHDGSPSAVGPATGPRSVVLTDDHDLTIRALSIGSLTSQPVADTAAGLAGWPGSVRLMHWFADLPSWSGHTTDPEPLPP